MGILYKIRCEHCGAEFDHYAYNDYGVLPKCVGCGDCVETELPMRCPACQHRLNTTQQEFNRQVKVVSMWD